MKETHKSEVIEPLILIKLSPKRASLQTRTSFTMSSNFTLHVNVAADQVKLLKGVRSHA
jgi:hypothetical protein